MLPELKLHFSRPTFPPSWYDLAPKLEPILEREGDADLADVLEMVATGEAMWWPLNESVGVTTIIDTQKRKLFLVWLFAGNLVDLHALIPQWESKAKELKCDAMQMRGRRGWLKELQKIDAFEKHVVMEKLL